MLFSILIANYNNGNFFKDCYNSIIAQTYINWEVIIVDDCSTDDSVPIIKLLIDGDSRFRFYCNEVNKGCGYTKRRSAELAKGEIAGFVDPDDAILKNALEIMAHTHKQMPNISLIHSSFYYCDDSLNTLSRFQIAEAINVSEKFTNLDGKVTHFVSFKTSLYKKTEGIDANLQRAVDQDLYLKLSEVGPFHFIDKPLYKYRLHKNGISTACYSKAFYCHLKAIGMTEIRRGVNLEDEVVAYLKYKATQQYFESNYSNSRFLVRRLLSNIKNHPIAFVKGLIKK